MSTSKKKFISAMGLAMVSSVALSGAAQASTNPFSAQTLEAGYQLAMSDNPEAAKDAEGKCGEGKCGGTKTTTEGKCGGKKTTTEGKCGEGKCGTNK